MMTIATCIEQLGRLIRPKVGSHDERTNSRDKFAGEVHEGQVWLSPRREGKKHDVDTYVYVTSGKEHGEHGVHIAPSHDDDGVSYRWGARAAPSTFVENKWKFLGWDAGWMRSRATREGVLRCPFCDAGLTQTPLDHVKTCPVCNETFQLWAMGETQGRKQDLTEMFDVAGCDGDGEEYLSTSWLLTVKLIGPWASINRPFAEVLSAADQLIDQSWHLSSCGRRRLELRLKTIWRQPAPSPVRAWCADVKAKVHSRDGGHDPLDEPSLADVICEASGLLTHNGQFEVVDGRRVDYCRVDTCPQPPFEG